jgi:hypothetical protein
VFVVFVLVFPDNLILLDMFFFMLDFVYLLVLIHQRTIYCPHPYDFKNYNGFAWWYFYLQLVSGEVEPTSLYSNCFHPHVLAMNVPRFYIYAGFDPPKNYLLSTSL